MNNPLKYYETRSKRLSCQKKRSLQYCYACYHILWVEICFGCINAFEIITKRNEEWGWNKNICRQLQKNIVEIINLIDNFKLERNKIELCVFLFNKKKNHRICKRKYLQRRNFFFIILSISTGSSLLNIIFYFCSF